MHPSSLRRGGGGSLPCRDHGTAMGRWLIGIGDMLAFAVIQFRLLEIVSRSSISTNIRDHLPPQSQTHIHTDLQALYSKPNSSSKMFYIPEALRSKGSGRINSTSDFPFMPLSDIYYIVQEYVQGMQNNFQELSRLIYQSALENDQILLTFQIGGMDGVSNDLMHNIFFLQEQLRLHSWFPIILEPVPTNFHKLTLNYADFQDKRGLPGTAIPQYAITSERDSGTCEFCHWNDTSTEQKFVDAPEWIRLQLGTLDCVHLENMMGEELSRLCVANGDLP
jgi:hypothetical protein